MRIEEKIDKYLNEGVFSNILKSVTKKAAIKYLSNHWGEFCKIAKSRGLEKKFLEVLNKGLKFKVDSLDGIQIGSNDKASIAIGELFDSPSNELFKNFISILTEMMKR